MSSQNERGTPRPQPRREEPSAEGGRPKNATRHFRKLNGRIQVDGEPAKSVAESYLKDNGFLK